MRSAAPSCWRPREFSPRLACNRVARFGVALWSGEEEGLLGSQAYVKAHFGSFESPKPQSSKLVGGPRTSTPEPGSFRGASVFGPAAAAAMLREISHPSRIWASTAPGMQHESAVTLGGTDTSHSISRDLPGIGFQQDPIEYNTHTHHTNLDTYERVIEEDVKKAAVILASTIYHLAMREEMLPRFAASEMPAPPPARGQ